MNLGDGILIKVNEAYVKRNFPTLSEYVNNLLRRSYFQVKKTDAVFAVASLNKNKIVVRGTAWAVYMYIYLCELREEKPNMYLFENNEGVWLKYISKNKSWIKLKLRPDPTKFNNWTGIGTRDLSLKAAMALREIKEDAARWVYRTMVTPLTNT